MIIPQKKQIQRRNIVSAPPEYIKLKLLNRSLDKSTVNQIKKSASETWKTQLANVDKNATTYNGFHTSKRLDEPTQHRVRPTSKCRINKPHPPNVFLVTRLNEIDGCFKPESAAAKRYGGDSQQKLNRYVAAHWQELKRVSRTSPLRRPGSSFEPSFRGDSRMQTVMGRIPQDTTESWLALNDEKKKEWAQKVLKNLEKASKKQPKFIVKDGLQYKIIDYGSSRISRTRRPFYDFQIHPEWQMEWHKQYVNSGATK